MGQVVISLITTESWLSKRSSAAALLFSLFHPYISMFISTCSSLFMLHFGLENVRGEAKLASGCCSAPALGRCYVYYVGNNPLVSAHFSSFCKKIDLLCGCMHLFMCETRGCVLNGGSSDAKITT
jgi:hypothetical protein